MELTNCSTVNFTTPNASTNFVTSIQIFHVIFGVFINSYSIWIIVRGSASGLAFDFFNLNLSVFENVLCLNSLLTVFILRFPKLFMATQYLAGLAITGRPLFQCLMCVERYLAVVHPVTFLKYKPLRYRLICSIVAWFIALSSSLLFTLVLVLLSEIELTLFYTLYFLLFFSIQLFCLVAVLRALKQSGPGDRKREKEENHMKRRAFYIILITFVSLFIIYVPSALVGVLRILTAEINQSLWLFSQCTFILAGLVQPALFLHRTGKLSCSTLTRLCQAS